ncbi:hypothetical protein FQA39_LY05938 [Lamprigera yunnana]|nr:hypothetical protein FQA39_LY05938 [Lamprigera yunnana]
MLRREKWLSAIKRDDLTNSKINYQRVCSKHFISGKPAALEYKDWILSQNLGHKSTVFTKILKLQIEVQVKATDGGNCIDDMDDLLTTITDDKVNTFKILIPKDKIFSNLTLDTSDYHKLDLPQQNSLSYFCGYLIKK